MLRLCDFLSEGLLSPETITAAHGHGFLVMENLNLRPTDRDRMLQFRTLQGQHISGDLSTVAADILRNPGLAPVYCLAPPTRDKFMLTLGRTPSVDIHLDHSTISKLHSWFRYDQQKSEFWVADAGSTNGTKLAGKNMKAHEAVQLKGGEALVFGTRINARFHTPQSLATYLIIARRLGADNARPSGMKAQAGV